MAVSKYLYNINQRSNKFYKDDAIFINITVEFNILWIYK